MNADSSGRGRALSAYDATYLGLAIGAGASLATFDDTLAKLLEDLA
jgi:predicted nucleic acid-binding protein